MKTHPKKQLTVICEAPVLRRITRILEGIPVSGYTVFPAMAGKGSEGSWDRDNWTGDAGRMLMVISIMSAEHAELAIDRIHEAIAAQMGIVTVADVDVLRPERF